MSEDRHIHFSIPRLTEEEMRARLDKMYAHMGQRRSIWPCTRRDWWP